MTLKQISKVIFNDKDTAEFTNNLETNTQFHKLYCFPIQLHTCTNLPCYMICIYLGHFYAKTHMKTVSCL